MSSSIESIRTELLKYKALTEGAIRQLADAELSASERGGNSAAVICWHVSGNLRSRFTDFLTSDGEKPWRKRDEEFQPRLVSREELLAKWVEGWQVLLNCLATLDDGQLQQTVTIRGQSVHVHDALHRALAHVAYHAGQVVFIAKSMRGKEWNYLSQPPSA